MSTLSIELDRYLTIRRSLGYRLDTSERILRRFVAFVDSRGAELITTDSFLQWKILHVETARGNKARSRNTRLAAIRSFFRYVAMNEPACALHCQKILTLPSKRAVQRSIDFLNRTEMDALLAVPDRSQWIGQRDYLLLLVALQTGLRVSELINLRRRDVVFGTGAHVGCEGKGRKHRCTPLRKDTARALEAWLARQSSSPDAVVFPSNRGSRLSRDAVERIVRKYATSSVCVSLQGKRVTPHVLRHSTAMELLQSGVDRSVIALWLGHECVETTGIYIHADLTIKEKALDRMAAPDSAPSGRYRPDDDLLAFLRSKIPRRCGARVHRASRRRWL